MSNNTNIGPYLNLFKGREDYFAQQGEDWYIPVQRILDEFYVLRHLEGDVTFGLYVLNKASCCHLVCVDIDIPKCELNEVDFKNSKAKYDYLKTKLDGVLEALSGRLGVPPESILLEDTGGRGYHIWVFFSDKIPGQTAVLFGEVLKKQLDFEIEFFPKQGRLTPTRKYGNLIKLPLGLHRKYGSWSFFFFLSAKGPHPIKDKIKGIAHLQTIVPVSHEVIHEIIKKFGKDLPLKDDIIIPISGLDHKRPQFEGNPDILVSQCTAMQNLRTKAEQGKRFSLTEAFNFADVMLSVPGGIKYVHNTMHLSLKTDYDQNRTNEEIKRIKPLHPPNCLTLVRKGICSDYCKDSVRKRNEDSLVPGTSPCSVWLKRVPQKHEVNTENLLARIGTIDNIKRVFFQLKQYHEHEDSLFFDPFDFEHFESRFDANSEVLAKSFIEKIEFPFGGYFSVSLPKKLNDALELEYRQMSYSSIYDQAPIQAIFNVVAPIVESEFQSTSYGYRWNKDANTPYRIFEDWREAYPRFRNEILAALKRHPNGFHVCCDIKGYYDHVDHNILLEQIRSFVPDTYIDQMIESVVRAYESEENSGRGLPQGPAYARLLANLYLNSFDIFAEKLSIAYFRYVDDLVLIFENKKKAEEGLELIVNRLQKQGLELSQDEAKKATIEPNIDISRVRRTLDKIHYGILEGSRHVEHLVPEAVEDFWNGVERHQVSPLTLDQLVKINDILPSLLYVVTQKSMFVHPLKPKVFNIIEFLIQKQWFCPKKLKTIFYRLLDLESDEDRLRQLFLTLNPIHKVYFLLSVFGCWKTHNQHLQLLKRLVHDALTDENSYVLGFAVAIASKIELTIDNAIKVQELIKKMSQVKSHFGLLKWLPTINYLDRSDDERASIRKLVKPESSEHVKMLLLANIKHLPTVYVDGIYLEGLIKDPGVLLIPVMCVLLVVATDKSEFLDSLLKSVMSRLAFKQLVVSHVAKGIFNKRATSGLAEIENLKALYNQISDDEMKQAMQSALSRIKQYGLACDVEFAKLHTEIDRYNGCFLFERVKDKAKYNYMELIPEGMLRDHIRCDLNTFKRIIDDFGAKEILPLSDFVYDSGKREVRLKFKTEKRYCVLDPNEFSLTHDESIKRACILAAGVYRKACYFQRFTGKAPRISPENLLTDSTTNTVIFRSIGRSLCYLHVFDGTIVGDEESDIAKMISILLEILLFNSKAEAKNFMNEKTHSGLKAFLKLFIKNMSAKEPGHRYSCSRFVYLVDQMTRKPRHEVTQNWQSMVYLRECLKGKLFRFNSEKITWNGICRALNEHLSTHIRVVCSQNVLRGFPFRSRVLLMGQGSRNLHTLAKYLLDLALSREDIQDWERVDAAYLDLVEFLLLYALVCVEIVAIGKTLRSTQILQCITSSPVLKQNRVKIIANGYEKDIAMDDIAALVIQESSEKGEETITGLSLFQLAIQCLFVCEIEFHDETVEVKKPKRMRNNEVFQKFIHACLVRIPNFEATAEKEIGKIFFALRSNEDFTRLEGLNKIRNDVKILANDLRQVRSKLQLLRHSGRADGRYFPPVIRCKSLLHRMRSVKLNALPGFALTNSSPFSRYKCSWDLQGSSVTSLIIPSEGVNSLMEDLKRGKFFGLKVSSIYSGKSMLLWDGALFVVNGFLLAICELLKDSATVSAGVVGFCSVFTYLLGALALTLFGKLALYDLGYWVPWHRRFVKYIQKTFSVDKESRKS